jgi:hypothetical protein
MKTMLYVLLSTKTQFLSTALVGLLLVGSGLWVKAEIDELNAIGNELMDPAPLPTPLRSWDERQKLNTQQPGTPTVDPNIKTLPGAKVPVGT